MQVPIHPQHISVLSRRRYGVCYACGLKLISSGYHYGYNYGCTECPLSFHIACANSIRRALKRKSHEHDLFYFGTDILRESKRERREREMRMREMERERERREREMRIMRMRMRMRERQH
ncbi:hypothetical protein DITRI_Ditri20bG0042900 [Diplodiscus trichospermus]